MLTMKFGAAILVGIALLFALLYFAASTAQNHQITFDTYISVMLTALGVMLAVLAIGTGIAAIWGYQQIKTAAETAAAIAVNERVNKLLELQDIHGMISAAVQKEGDRVFVDLNVTGADLAGDSEPIANSYPDEDE
jgi:hypothetical protein